MVRVGPEKAEGSQLPLTRKNIKIRGPRWHAWACANFRGATMGWFGREMVRVPTSLGGPSFFGEGLVPEECPPAEQ